jgi:hypothetical protein
MSQCPDQADLDVSSAHQVDVDAMLVLAMVVLLLWVTQSLLYILIAAASAHTALRSCWCLVQQVRADSWGLDGMCWWQQPQAQGYGHHNGCEIWAAALLCSECQAPCTMIVLGDGRCGNVCE